MTQHHHASMCDEAVIANVSPLLVTVSSIQDIVISFVRFVGEHTSTLYLMV